MNTVLPERLSPVTASKTVALPANSLRLPTSRSDACATIGGSQLKFIMDGIPPMRCKWPQSSGARKWPSTWTQAGRGS